MNALEGEDGELVTTFPVTVSSGCLGLTKQQSMFAVFHKT